MTRFLLLCAALCACVPDNGPLMQPGEDCLFCHSAKGGATVWTAAGTVFQTYDGGQGFEGAQVHITDATGFAFSLRTNEAGNFYTGESIQFPLTACIEANGSTVCQQSPIMSDAGPGASGGSCNFCHGQANFGAVQPPLAAP